MEQNTAKMHLHVRLFSSFIFSQAFQMPSFAQWVRIEASSTVSLLHQVASPFKFNNAEILKFDKTI